MGLVKSDIEFTTENWENFHFQQGFSAGPPVAMRLMRCRQEESRREEEGWDCPAVLGVTRTASCGKQGRGVIVLDKHRYLGCKE